MVAEKKRTRSVRPLEANATSTDYPTLGSPPDPGRRRFLRQLAAGSGAVGLVSGGGLLRAQTGLQTDFSVLEAHETAVAVDEAAAPMRRQRSARREAPPEPEPGERADSTATAPAETVWVTENRALWVEPGYLVLLRWRRPEGDEGVVSALEGSSEAVAFYLSEVVTDPPTELHDVDALAVFEAGVVAVLSATITPATIEALHLDHDCQIVCPAPEIEHPIVRGRMAPPSR